MLLLKPLTRVRFAVSSNQRFGIITLLFDIQHKEGHSEVSVVYDKQMAGWRFGFEIAKCVFSSNILLDVLNFFHFEILYFSFKVI